MDHNRTIPVITIDGPGASGKGTVAKRLADHLEWHLLDSGAVYRAFAWGFLQERFPQKKESYQAVISKLSVEYLSDYSTDDMHICYAGQVIDWAIRDEECAQMASKMAVLPFVRQALLPLQQQARRAPGLVADGRDMGTVVFPDAKFKFYLDASPEVRAQRRYNQLNQQGIHANLSDILQDLLQRDHRDQSRKISPAEPGKDTELIDTGHLSVEQVFSAIVGRVNSLV